MRVKVVGTRHSFNEIADTDGIHVSLANFESVAVSDIDVTIGAGVTYSKLIEVLVKHKLAIENLPSLPHVNVVGSLVTGTHGGGVNLPVLIEYASHYRYLNHLNEYKDSTLGEDPDFYTRIQSFGAGGIITQMTLKVIPEFAVRKCVYTNMPWTHIFDSVSYEQILNSGKYLSMFTDWTSETMSSVWIGNPHDEWNRNMKRQPGNRFCASEFFGA